MPNGCSSSTASTTLPATTASTTASTAATTSSITTATTASTTASTTVTTTTTSACAVTTTTLAGYGTVTTSMAPGCPSTTTTTSLCPVPPTTVVGYGTVSMTPGCPPPPPACPVDMRTSTVAGNASMSGDYRLRPYPCGPTPMPTPGTVAHPVASKPVFTGWAGGVLALVGAALLLAGVVFMSGAQRRHESRVIR